MMKAISLGEVRVGDVVRVRAGWEARKVLAVTPPGENGMMSVHLEGDEYPEHDHQGLILELVYRPLTDGKTEAQMLAEARDAAGFFAERGMGIVPLRELMDAYELGKPQ